MKTDNEIMMRIGNTPLVLLEEVAGNKIYVKLEGHNPGGSIKDRIAKQMILSAIEKGLLAPGKKAVEGTSGNTGIGLALCCQSLGIPLTICMPENMSKERQDLLRGYGAEILLTPKALGMNGTEAKAKELADEGYFFFDQFHNPANVEAHEKTTGPEIKRQLDAKIDIFVAGVGTGGTLMGAGGFLKRECGTALYAVEPLESQVLSGKPAGPHGIQGIGANFLPPLFRDSLVDGILPIATEEAKKKVGTLYKEGHFVGISSAANILAAEQLANEHPNEGLNIVTVSPDDGSKYLSLGLYEK